MPSLSTSADERAPPAHSAGADPTIWVARAAGAARSTGAVDAEPSTT